MRDKKPILFDWALIRINPVGRLDRIGYHFTGIVQGHPLLPNDARIVTTAIQKIAKDLRWGRTRSRVYNLGRNLEAEEFSGVVAGEIRDILHQEFGYAFDIEWISVDTWMTSVSGKSSHANP